MITATVLMLYIPTTLLAYVLPGPDWLVVTQNTFVSKKNGLFAAMGVQSGLLFHIFLGTMATYALFLISEHTMSLIQAIGALYTIWLGYQAIQDALTHHRDPRLKKRPKQPIKSYIAGFITDFSNPKAALFFISIFPQFIDRNHNLLSQILILGITDILIGFLWWLLFIQIMSKIGSYQQDAGFKVKIEIFAGSLLILLGITFFLRTLKFLL
ncbi:MAG: LysE family translocator [Neisseriaceae bacterium]